MTVPAQLADLLETRLDGVTRVQLVHLRRRKFRWLSLFELAFGLVLALLCLVCILLLALLVFAESDGDMGDVTAIFPKPRFFAYWHELQVRFLNGEGQVLAEHLLTPRDQDEGDAVVGSLLNAAGREGLVVVEALGEAPRETLEVWYGGQPLLAHPERRDEEECTRSLEAKGWQVELDEVCLVLRRTDDPANRIWAFFRWGIQLPLLPVLFWRRAFREPLGVAWSDMLGVAPAVHCLELDRTGLRARTERGGRVLFECQVDHRDLLGVAHSPSLGYDRDVSRHHPELRLLERTHATEVPSSLVPREVGRVVRDHLIVSAQRLWAGIPGTSNRPTRCPYCGATYVFAPGVTCPSCGAAPSA